MNIYMDYTSDDVLENSPCFVLGCGLIYPLLIKDYSKFLSKYGTYFMFGEEGIESQLINIESDSKQSYLDKVVFFNALIKCQPDVFGQVKMDSEKAINEVVNDLSSAFSIVTKKQIKYNKINNTFSDENEEGNKTVLINENNFSDVRKVIAMQNLIKEPLIYEDQEYAELMAEARRQRNKKNGGSINLSEIIAYVKNYGKLRYEEVYNQNALQLYSDYRVMSQMENYRTTMAFNCVSTEFTNIGLTEQFIDELFKPNDDSDLLRDSSYLYDDGVFK